MLIAFSVTPLGVGDDADEIIEEAVRVVRTSGLPHHTDAAFITIEGADCDEIMGVVRAAVEAVRARAPEVRLLLDADLRPGATVSADGRSRAAEAHLVSSDR
jgi:uncharacterized protein YqgV (UPF0045/DUF77 family)